MYVQKLIGICTSKGANKQSKKIDFGEKVTWGLEGREEANWTSGTMPCSAFLCLLPSSY